MASLSETFVTKSYDRKKKKMPMVNGKKYPYTKAGMNAAKKAAAKKKPMQKRPGMARTRKPGMRRPGMR